MNDWRGSKRVSLKRVSLGRQSSKKKKVTAFMKKYWRILLWLALQAFFAGNWMKSQQYIAEYNKLTKPEDREKMRKNKHFKALEAVGMINIPVQVNIRPLPKLPNRRKKSYRRRKRRSSRRSRSRW